ncbi:kinase-like protein [Rickenella mellea]|uniref:Kinase-like protein n=1 Tax=Rickenella mellea TaxID=50990 RepID=A0A4Y7PQY5_9AGAM|nr:kinase-like protein [Rickenella mellea]
MFQPIWPSTLMPIEFLWCSDVAKGLDYLHLFVSPIVHEDLKGANIFVKSDLTACLGDFGLSYFRDSVDGTLFSTTGHTTGTLRWQALELFQRGDDGRAKRPSRESDIYSFGCVCLEPMTSRTPFSEIRTVIAVLAAIMNHQTPRRPCADLAHRGLDESLWAVMKKCWNQDPKRRPTTKDLAEYFNLRIKGLHRLHHLSVSNGNVQDIRRTSRRRINRDPCGRRLKSYFRCNVEFPFSNVLCEKCSKASLDSCPRRVPSHPTDTTWRDATADNYGAPQPIRTQDRNVPIGVSGPVGSLWDKEIMTELTAYLDSLARNPGGDWSKGDVLDQ